MNFLEAIEAKVEEQDRRAAQSSIRQSILNCIRQEKVGVERASELVRAKMMEAVEESKESLYADLRLEDPTLTTAELDEAFVNAKKKTADMIEETVADVKATFEQLRELVHIDEAYDRKPIV